MSDTADTPTDVPTDTGTDAPVDTSTTDAAPPPSSKLDEELPTRVDSFGREYVEGIRSEAAQYRTRMRELEEQLQQRSPWDEAAEGYNDDDLQVWRTLMTTYRNDPTSAADMMRKIVDHVTGQGEQQETDSPDLADDQFGEALTPDKVQEMIAADREQREIDASVKQIESDIKAAVREVRGDEGEIGDQDPDVAQVLWHLTTTADYDPQTAIQQWKDHRQATIDRFVASKRSPGAPRSPDHGNAAGEQQEAPKSWDDARKQATRFLRERQEAG